MRRTIAIGILLGSLLAGGITACSKTNTSDAPSDTPQSSVPQSNTPQSNLSQSPERAQRREAMRKQIEAVLTPDQVQQLHTKLQQGTRMRDAIASLNLTADQKAKIQDIMKAARAQRSDQPPASSSQ